MPGRIPNKKRIRKWVDALRSKKYKQTTGALKRNGGFCCLGVACKVYQGETKIGRFAGEDFIVDGKPFDEMLPNPVADWLGINTNPVLKVPGDELAFATTLNDEYKLSFPEIADAIEHTFLKGD